MNFLRMARLFNQGFDRHRHRASWSLCLRCSRRICLDLWYPGSGHGLTRVVPLSSCMAVNRLRLSSTLQSSNEHHGLHGLLVSRIGTYIRRLSPPCTGDRLWFADVLDDSKHTDGTFLFVFFAQVGKEFPALKALATGPSPFSQLIFSYVWPGNSSHRGKSHVSSDGKFVVGKGGSSEKYHIQLRSSYRGVTGHKGMTVALCHQV